MMAVRYRGGRAEEKEKGGLVLAAVNSPKEG